MHLMLLALTLASVQAPDETIHMIETAPAESVAVHVSGDSCGLPVVIVPGLLGSAFGYRNVTPGLVTAGVRVLIVDPLGTGSSTAPSQADYSMSAQAGRITSAIRQLGVERAVFVCHALGAAICYRLALHSPDIVAGIVSINGGAAERMSTPGLGFALRFAPIIKLLGGARIARGKIRDGLINSSGDPSWVTDEVVNGYTEHYRHGVKPVLQTLQRMSKAEEPSLLAPQLPSIDSPVHVLVGAGSRTGALRPEEVEILRTLDDVRFDSIAGAGQYIHEEQPDVVVHAILELLDGVQVERPGVQSDRSASPGSSRVARCAGSQAASSAIPRSSSGTAVNVTGSMASMP
jgi:pimeloyl-ACP methyl ester carboxylesterase